MIPWATWFLGVYTIALLVSMTTSKRLLRGIAATVACLILGAVVVDGQLERAGNWGIVLWWAAALTVGGYAVVQRHVRWRPVGLVLIGYLATLSWGYDSPTLLGGSFALLAVELLARDLPTSADRARIAGSAAAAILLVATLGWMSELRLKNPYRDLPAGKLTADLGASIPALRGTRTNPATADYVEQIVRCLDRYPASHTAVLPDNAFVYPAMRIRNPFPSIGHFRQNSSPTAALAWIWLPKSSSARATTWSCSRPSAVAPSPRRHRSRPPSRSTLRSRTGQASRTAYALGSPANP